MEGKYHINPRFRAYGKARLDVTLRAKNEKEWQEMWREPLNPFPFRFGTGWKFSFEYKVDDYAAEVGFFIDVLGFSVRAFSPRYAQFSSPGQELTFSVMQAGEDEDSTPPDSLRLQLQVTGIEKVVRDLERRGVVYEQTLSSIHDSESTFAGFFRTPHGVRIELWDQLSEARDVDADLLEDEDILDNDDYDVDDEPINLEDLDEDEADRLLNELLGLSDDEADPEDDLDDADDPDELDLEAESEPEGSIDEITDQDPAPRTLFSKNILASQRKRIDPEQHKPIDHRSLRPPAATSKSRGTIWHQDDDRRNGELVYDEIDEDLPYDQD